MIHLTVDESLSKGPSNSCTEALPDIRVNQQNRFLQFKAWCSEITLSCNHSLSPCMHPSGSSDPLNILKGTEKFCSWQTLKLHFCKESQERRKFPMFCINLFPNLICRGVEHLWPLLSSPAEPAKTTVHTPEIANEASEHSPGYQNHQLLQEVYPTRSLNPPAQGNWVILSAPNLKMHHWHLSLHLFFQRD